MCRTFTWVGPKWERLPSGVLGLLIKKLYPGMVDYKKDGVPTGERGPARSWAHFTMVEDSVHGHVGFRLLAEFWVSSFYNFTTKKYQQFGFRRGNPFILCSLFVRTSSLSLMVKVKTKRLKRR
jgi:hypothetical protein